MSGRVKQDVLLAFKHEAMASLARIVAVLATASPGLGARGARSMMTAANSLAAISTSPIHTAA